MINHDNNKEKYLSEVINAIPDYIERFYMTYNHHHQSAIALVESVYHEQNGFYTRHGESIIKDNISMVNLMDRQKAIKLVKEFYCDKLNFIERHIGNNLELIRLTLSAIEERTRTNGEDDDKFLSTIMRIFKFSFATSPGCERFLKLTEILSIVDVLSFTSDEVYPSLTPYGKELLESLENIKDNYDDVLEYKELYDKS